MTEDGYKDPHHSSLFAPFVEKIASIDRGWLLKTLKVNTPITQVEKIASIDRGWLRGVLVGTTTVGTGGENSLD